MDIGLLFWILMILWMISSLGGYFRTEPYWGYGTSVFQLVLFFLLGWQVFGPMLRSGGHG
jgi:hypothetical protein